MTGLLGDNYRLMQLLGGIGLLGSKRGSQADRYMKIATQGLLGRGEAERQAAKDKTAADLATAQMAYYQSKANETPGREMFEQGGVKYWKDTLEPVLPDAQQTNPVFKTPKEELDAKLKIQGEFVKRTDMEKKVFDSFNRATRMINNRGGFDKLTGADSTVFAKAYANMILPTEAVQEGDMATIAAQGGFRGLSKNIISKLIDGKVLDPSETALMYQSMMDMHNSSIANAENVKADLWPSGKKVGFDYGNLFGAGRYTVPADIPPGLLKITPKTKPVGNNQRSPAKADSILNRWFGN